MGIETDRATLIREGDEEVIRQQQERRRKKGPLAPEVSPRIKEIINEWVRMREVKLETEKKKIAGKKDV